MSPNPPYIYIYNTVKPPIPSFLGGKKNGTVIGWPVLFFSLQYLNKNGGTKGGAVSSDSVLGGGAVMMKFFNENLVNMYPPFTVLNLS